MVMQVIRNSSLARGVGAWESVKNDWQGLQGPRGVTRPLSDIDVKNISNNRELAHKIKSAVAPIQQGREHLRSVRETTLKSAAKTPGTSIFDKVKKVFHAMADDLKAVREIYKNAIPEAFKSVVKEHGGKTFSKEQRLPKPLILAAVPKDKENKDLSMKTLIKGIKDLKQYMDHKKTHEPRRVTHSSQVLASDDHIVLQRVIGGKEEVLEMAFRRAGKVDIYLNGKAKPEGSLWNDDALATAAAFLKGKDLFFHKRKAEKVEPKEYVICQKRSLLAGK